ncbi:hypothetical protein HOF65_02620 [bacterium]|nr:hypothetical protein [bacterium]
MDVTGSFNTIVSNNHANVVSSVSKFNTYSIIHSLFNDVSHIYANFMISITAALSASTESLFKLFNAPVNTSHVNAHVFDITFPLLGIFSHSSITNDCNQDSVNSFVHHAVTSSLVIKLGIGTI